MSLTYADFCTQCGKRRTRHPSGLCCDCRRKLNDTFTPKMACRYCGAHRDKLDNGLCSACRQESSGEDEYSRQTKAIEELKTNLSILEQREAGISFDDIAENVGLGKTAVFRRYRMLVPADSTEKAYDVII